MTQSGKIVLVSGGTFGIGRAITVGLARRGHAVIAFGLEAVQVSSTAQAAIPGLREELEKSGLKAELLEGDVSRSGDVAKIVDKTVALYGRVDAVVNNAAIGPLGTVLDTDEALFDQIVSVNLKGPYLTSRAAIPHMIRQGGGSIINIGSGAAWGKPNMAVYSASKGGLLALGASMAYDFFHDRIRVNTVIPGGGGIVSGMSLGRTVGDPSQFGKGALGTAAGRVATGADVANVVAFLLSSEADTLSGAVIDVGCFAHQGGPVPSKRAPDVSQA
jgi:NAD(P)-dependent dehydrogenase (short-subunit alcohol dehydrogenase family)